MVCFCDFKDECKHYRKNCLRLSNTGSLDGLCIMLAKVVAMAELTIVS